METKHLLKLIENIEERNYNTQAGDLNTDPYFVQLKHYLQGINFPVELPVILQNVEYKELIENVSNYKSLTGHLCDILKKYLPQKNMSLNHKIFFAVANILSK